MTIQLIDVPIDLGASERGVSLGPTALRMAGLEERLGRLGYEVMDDPAEPLYLPRHRQAPGEQKLRYLESIAEACSSLRRRVYGALVDGRLPLVLGGDHSLAMGSVSGAAEYCRERGLRLGLLWIDAHGDYNTPETTPSGNLHGMPLAVLNGLGHPKLLDLVGAVPAVDPRYTVLFATRDLDPGEKALLRQSPARVITMMDIDAQGMRGSVELALRTLEACDVLHVSLDIDSLDPKTAPGVGTPVPGGLTYREAHFLLESLAETGKVRSVDLVEVNPLLDHRNRTARLAVELAASLLGSRIL